MEKVEKFLTVAAIIICSLMLIFTIWFVFEFIEMLNDHRCYELPPNEFYQDKRCERYWDYK